MMRNYSQLPMLINLILLGIIYSTFAHQSASFPGTDSNQLPAHAHGQQQQPNAGGQQQPNFGGEQAKDEGHIKEHLEGKVDPTANMTPEQLQFHYFNMHDLSKDSKLDGVELIKAITHFHQEHSNQQQQQGVAPPPLPNEMELEQMIDSILRDDDFNGDGYIDYSEFLRAQKQREENARQHQQQQQQQQQQPKP